MKKRDGQPIERACGPTAATPNDAYLFVTVGGTAKGVLNCLNANRKALGLNSGLELSVGKVGELMTPQGIAKYGIQEPEELRGIMAEREFPSTRGEDGRSEKFRMEGLRYFVRARAEGGVMEAISSLDAIDRYLESNRDSKGPYCSKIMAYMGPTNGWADYTPD